MGSIVQDVWWRLPCTSMLLEATAQSSRRVCSLWASTCTWGQISEDDRSFLTWGRYYVLTRDRFGPGRIQGPLGNCPLTGVTGPGRADQDRGTADGAADAPLRPVQSGNSNSNSIIVFEGSSDCCLRPRPLCWDHLTAPVLP